MERLSEKLLEIINEQDFCFTPQEMFAVRRAIGRFSAYEDFVERWKLTSIEAADRIFRRVNALGGTDLMGQYLDLGPIDHLRSLVQAEKDGRLVELPPNEPLTLEELREMDGEPVFVAMSAFGCSGYWGIIHNGWVRFGDGDSTPIEKIVGLAYRRKPEEGN